MGLIPNDVIDEIRHRADIVSVIGHHVELKKRGRNHVGLCPFHHEKSPSFNVSADKQFFYCFGCHKKGNVITFLMEFEGKSFVEAVEALAAQTGVVIPEREESPAARRQRSERARMLEVNALAARFFQDTLAHPERGAPGRRYLQGRGITDETARAFGLGYAPDGWQELSDFLASQRASMELAEKVGLIGSRRTGAGYYDRFRGRLMCPVILPSGDIAGFSGRVVGSMEGEGGEQRAKYINSPESPIYKKSKLLYGLHAARNAFRRTGHALLVEGNFDVISLHQAGFTEAVAPLGTALTDEQVDLCRRLADSVVLLYDGDRAGRAATHKATEMLIAADVSVYVAILDEGDDPDSLIVRGGADALRAVLDRAQPGMEYIVYELWMRSERSIAGRSQAIESATKLIGKVANPTKRDLIIDTLAQAMNVDPGVVRRALGRHDRQKVHEPPKPQPPRTHPAPRVSPPPDEELQILAILADHPDLMPVAEERDVISLLTDARSRDMYCAARQDVHMMSVVPDDIGPLVAKRVFAGSYAGVKDPRHTLLEATETLRKERLRQRQIELQRQLEDAERRGEVARARQLLQEIQTTRKSRSI